MASWKAPMTGAMFGQELAELTPEDGSVCRFLGVYPEGDTPEGMLR